MLQYVQQQLAFCLAPSSQTRNSSTGHSAGLYNLGQAPEVELATSMSALWPRSGRRRPKTEGKRLHLLQPVW